MSEALITAQIKIIMESVTGIGVVHDYFRYVRSWADWLALMTHTVSSPPSSKINGWMFQRQKTTSSKLASGYIENVHTYNFLGLYEIDDAGASGKAFEAILDAIQDKFKDYPNLNGTVWVHDLIQIDEVGIDDYENVSYHYAGLSLTVHERVSK
jgi:hypothetical protein